MKFDSSLVSLQLLIHSLESLWVNVAGGKRLILIAKDEIIIKKFREASPIEFQDWRSENGPSGPAGRFARTESDPECARVSPEDRLFVSCATETPSRSRDASSTPEKDTFQSPPIRGPSREKSAETLSESVGNPASKRFQNSRTTSIHNLIIHNFLTVTSGIVCTNCYFHAPFSRSSPFHLIIIYTIPIWIPFSFPIFLEVEVLSEE